MEKLLRSTSSSSTCSRCVLPLTPTLGKVLLLQLWGLSVSAAAPLVTAVDSPAGPSRVVQREADPPRDRSAGPCPWGVQAMPWEQETLEAGGWCWCLAVIQACLDCQGAPWNVQCEALGGAGDSRKGGSCCAGNKYLGMCLRPGGGCAACVTANVSVPHLGVFLDSKLFLLCEVGLFLAWVLV